MRIRLKYLCSSFSTPITQDQIKSEGRFAVYGASGIVGYKDDYASGCEYLGIIKDGAGVGRVNYYPAKSSLLGTLAYIIPIPEVNIFWLKYVIQGLDLGKNTSSTTIPHIYFKDYGNKYVELPSKEVQQNIASFLDEKCSGIDLVLEQTRSSIEEYKKLKQAFITEVVTRGIRGSRLMKDSGISWLKQIPEEWGAERGKNLFVETKELSDTGEEELLTVSHITGVTPRSEKNVNMFMSESLVGYKICHKGDLAANTMWMWQGAIGVSKHEGVISPSYNTYRQRNNDYEPDYLEYLLRVPPLVATYSAYSTGITASRLRLYPDQFFSILFPIPSKEEQREIVDYLNGKIPEMDKLIQKKEQFLVELENYKKSMIYEYVTGKKEVPQS